MTVDGKVLAQPILSGKPVHAPLAPGPNHDILLGNLSRTDGIAVTSLIFANGGVSPSATATVEAVNTPDCSQAQGTAIIHVASALVPEGTTVELTFPTPVVVPGPGFAPTGAWSFCSYIGRTSVATQLDGYHL